jgi:hypothetical protein
MENLYRSTPGLILRQDYEEALISMSVLILNYLILIHDGAPADNALGGKNGEVIMMKIREAERACRDFAVVIDTQEERKDVTRTMEDISEESDERSSVDLEDEESTTSAHLNLPNPKQSTFKSLSLKEMVRYA